MEERRLTSRNDDKYTNYSVEVVRVTAKALQVKHLALDKDGPEIWVPKSVCQNSEHVIDDLGEGDNVELRIADWFAKKEGFY